MEKGEVTNTDARIISKEINKSNRNVHSYSQCNAGNNSEAKYTSEGKWMKLGMHIHNRTIFYHKRQNHAVHAKRARTAEHYVKWNKSDKERQVPNNGTHMQNHKEVSL